MTDAIADTPKKRGRPSTGGRQEGVMVRFPADQLARLDRWREAQPEQPTRPEAIRQLLDGALPGL